MKISRRKMIQATAAAMSLPAFAKAPSPSPKPLFFTLAEFALVDEICDMIIPTDQQSGGARAAGVAIYIDGRLAEAFEQDEPQRWRSGLKAVEALSQEMHAKTFMGSDPKTDAEKFFRQIKGATIRAYYTSKIGIHDDQQYKGNVIQPGEYAGYDAT